ncbi:gamma-butyrobetaine hydroxylase-like domain-containing protein [Amorphus sp. 3PC139-8]|uniref:gamma-butyrobetaine hydroxylase-like domain-containing protein n=1 Tax=Amorphus sp. 3PC139-8 TaxID=2735676 RepID=UPI00345CD8D0
MTATLSAWPSELRLKKGRQTLAITWDDGSTSELAAEYLRVQSPSAEVKGHTPSERKTVGGKRDVTISAIEPVGNYAVRLVFADGHSTGIYTFRYLAELARDHDRIWQDYLTELEAKGLARDRPGAL